MLGGELWCYTSRARLGLPACRYIVYDAQYNSNTFGIKVKAKATVAQPALRVPWLLDIMQGVSSVAARCACVLLRGEVAPDASTTTGAPSGKAKATTSAPSRPGDAAARQAAAVAAKEAAADEVTAAASAAAKRRAVSAWLSSELVANGLNDDALTADPAAAKLDLRAQQLLAGLKLSDVDVPTSGARAPTTGADAPAPKSKLDELLPLVSELETRMANVPVASAKLTTKATASVNKVVRATVAVMLVHNHLVDAARTFVAGTTAEAVTEPPPALVRVWKTSHRIKLWLRTRFQTRLLDATREAHAEAERKARAKALKEMEQAESKTAGAEEDSKVGAAARHRAGSAQSVEGTIAHVMAPNTPSACVDRDPVSTGGARGHESEAVAHLPRPVRWRPACVQAAVPGRPCAPGAAVPCRHDAPHVQ